MIDLNNVHYDLIVCVKGQIGLSRVFGKGICVSLTDAEVKTITLSSEGYGINLGASAGAVAIFYPDFEYAEQKYHGASIGWALPDRLKKLVHLLNKFPRLIGPELTAFRPDRYEGMAFMGGVKFGAEVQLSLIDLTIAPF